MPISALPRSTAERAFGVILLVILLIELIVFVLGFIPSLESPFRISFWVIKNDGLYNHGYSIWSWVGNSTMSSKMNLSLSLLCLSVSINFAIIIFLSVLFWIPWSDKLLQHHTQGGSPKRIIPHSIFAILIRGTFFIALLASLAPILLYELLLLRTIDADHRELQNHSNTQNIHQGPSFYLWCIAIALHISAIYLAIRITRLVSSPEDEDDELKTDSIMKTSFSSFLTNKRISTS